MKKIFCFIAFLLCLNAAFCQVDKPAREEIRFVFAKLMTLFTESVSSYYKEGMTQEEFQHNLPGKSLPTETGKNLIAAAFQILITKEDKEITLRNYGGAEVAKYIQQINTKEEVITDAEIFGITDEASQTFAKEGSCKWYQIRCHFKKLVDWLNAVGYLIIENPLPDYPYF